VRNGIGATLPGRRRRSHQIDFPGLRDTTTVGVVAPLLEHSAVEAEHHHVVQFYDSDADLVARAGSYLREAVDAEAVAVVIATEAHRRAFEEHLRAAGVDVAGSLRWLDAAELLGRFMRDGRVDRDAFFENVGGIVRGAAASGRAVRAYGEMVALLWEAGDVLAAIDLETLWNELASEVRFSLYCAYHGESVSGHEHADALQRVCELHTEIVPAAERTWEFPLDATSPSRARRLVTDALRRAGHGGDLLDDARLVITELAANAVKHARSPFSVSIRTGESTIRILVRDASLLLPEMSEDSPTTPGGRGLRLVGNLAARWGVDSAPDGKVVWVELGR
jgi:anti-sigma regulatory factor (Ser/Thr protein kinase)